MNFIKAVMAPAFLMLAGCVTYPYESAFNACDDEAGACYQYCADVSDSEAEGAACRADCEVGANQCFADAYDRYDYNRSAYRGAYYEPSWPWYGRYGAWGPRRGYYFDFTYWGGSGRYYPPRYRHRYGGRRHPRGGGGGAGDDGGSPPAATPEPRKRMAPPLRTQRSAPPQQSAPSQAAPAPRQERSSPPPRRRTAPPVRKKNSRDSQERPEFTQSPENDQ